MGFDTVACESISDPGLGMGWYECKMGFGFRSLWCKTNGISLYKGEGIHNPTTKAIIFIATIELVILDY